MDRSLDSVELGYLVADDISFVFKVSNVEVPYTRIVITHRDESKTTA